jgi:hypothetical protein
MKPSNQWSEQTARRVAETAQPVLHVIFTLKTSTWISLKAIEKLQLEPIAG